MDTLDLYVYSWIGEWEDEVSSADVVALLASHAQADRVRVFMNSGGGNVYEGLAIYNALARHPARVEVLVEGVAASIASCILQAGDLRQIAPTANVMIHDPSGGQWGTAKELLTTAQQLETAAATMADLYAERSGQGDPASWRAAMEATTWYTAAEAVAAGLCDEVTAQPVIASPPNPFARLAQTAAPAASADRPPVQTRLALRTPQTRGSVPVTASLRPTQTPPPMASYLDKLKTKLGLKAEATEEEIEQALDTLDDKAEPAKEPETEPATPEPTTEAPTASADEAPAWAKTLVEQNRQIAARLDARDAADRERLVDEAVADMRIQASERDAWLRRLGNDFDAESKVLAALRSGGASPSASGVRPPSSDAPGAGDETRPKTRAEIRAQARAEAEARAKQSVN